MNPMGWWKETSTGQARRDRRSGQDHQYEIMINTSLDHMLRTNYRELKAPKMNVGLDKVQHAQPTKTQPVQHSFTGPDGRVPPIGPSWYRRMRGNNPPVPADSGGHQQASQTPLQPLPQEKLEEKLRFEASLTSGEDQGEKHEEQSVEEGGPAEAGLKSGEDQGKKPEEQSVEKGEA